MIECMTTIDMSKLQFLLGQLLTCTYHEKDFLISEIYFLIARIELVISVFSKDVE